MKLLSWILLILFILSYGGSALFCSGFVDIIEPNFGECFNSGVSYFDYFPKGQSPLEMLGVKLIAACLVISFVIGFIYHKFKVRKQP
ncbi:hypothetical protein H5154_05735 [Pseudoalteromonas sp. SR44-5]|uniref:hypothetical protein n=1 Tax=Pseudoalteromonas TaxID=53246 RepID=UPI001231747B|nr:MULTISPECIES: hypothetical protein [Pseudoalteromonas]MBB1365892.1 hypothetical protein [Pseudoalteromonas sp. SR44-5]MBB1416219.1 hypothetical protein [Pseudoalteromonas sp. SG44-1]MBB1467249.1 hypothetical protein [Pseudoalteromonas sp. SG41-5]